MFLEDDSRGDVERKYLRAYLGINQDKIIRPFYVEGVSGSSYPYTLVGSYFYKSAGWKPVQILSTDESVITKPPSPGYVNISIPRYFSVILVKYSAPQRPRKGINTDNTIIRSADIIKRRNIPPVSNGAVLHNLYNKNYPTYNEKKVNVAYTPHICAISYAAKKALYVRGNLVGRIKGDKILLWNKFNIFLDEIKTLGLPVEII